MPTVCKAEILDISYSILYIKYKSNPKSYHINPILYRLGLNLKIENIQFDSPIPGLSLSAKIMWLAAIISEKIQKYIFRASTQLFQKGNFFLFDSHIFELSESAKIMWLAFILRGQI